MKNGFAEKSKTSHGCLPAATGRDYAACSERIVDNRGKVSCETSYYISSLDVAPEQLMKIAREHWKIESMHWMLDVIFSEDDRRFSTENAHKMLNSMRKYALAVHKNFLSVTKKKSSMKSNMLACLLNHNLFLKLLEFL